ncbi:MAG TPA: malto-oligosyltrehalose trehalohydrolase [Candidatus Acidoferrales bacterium]|nr:malto-oligosyltrehalose trehalohydrolase [Candidatus Acidoferrales bacterium]
MNRTHAESRVPLGANRLADGQWEFSVWAPRRQKVALHFLDPVDRLIPMTRNEAGYHQASVHDLPPHSRYLYRLDDSQEYPDPVSRFQPEGVHGPSEIVDLSTFRWTDGDWKAPSLTESIFYELHVGTFSEAGTLDGAAAHLESLAELGVTTIELMPVAQFPGGRNWGYDGVYPFAVQNTYGGPLALQRFVNAAHALGLAVALDVVYNHLGPEGNYLSRFGPYFTDRYHTPWGEAINFDGADSGPVRHFFIDNAIFWLEQFHIDVLRLDAIHSIFDGGVRHILAQLQEQVESASRRLDREFHLIAESNLNDPRVLLPREQGGHGIAAEWTDDFHFSLHALLTREAKGHYADFGKVSQLATVFRDGWFFQGQHSKYRRGPHGKSPGEIPRSHFVAYHQNHDQIGNRMWGERIGSLVNFEAQKLAAGMILLSPFVPLLFMGEEYGEPAPFLYFTSHSDPELIEAVRRGRRKEFSEFGWSGDAPDPQSESAFTASRLRHEFRDVAHLGRLRRFYQELIRFRRANRLGEDADLQITESEDPPCLTVLRDAAARRLLMIFNFGDAEVEVPNPGSRARWTTELNSADLRWLGPGEHFPQSMAPADTFKLRGKSFVVLGQDGGR